MLLLFFSAENEDEILFEGLVPVIQDLSQVDTEEDVAAGGIERDGANRGEKQKPTKQWDPSQQRKGKKTKKGKIKLVKFNLNFTMYFSLRKR